MTIDKMDMEIVEKLREIKSIKEIFEESVSSKFQIFYIFIEEYVIGAEMALHYKDLNKLNQDLSPEICFGALKTIRATKETLEFLKQHIENDLKSWIEFEEKIKFIQKEYQSITAHPVPNNLNIMMGENSQVVVASNNVNTGTVSAGDSATFGNSNDI